MIKLGNVVWSEVRQYQYGFTAGRNFRVTVMPNRLPDGFLSSLLDVNVAIYNLGLGVDWRWRGGKERSFNIGHTKPKSRGKTEALDSVFDA